MSGCRHALNTCERVRSAQRERASMTYPLARQLTSFSVLTYLALFSFMICALSRIFTASGDENNAGSRQNGLEGGIVAKHTWKRPICRQGDWLDVFAASGHYSQHSTTDVPP